MATGIRLADYPATPLYNIKAVVQATGISPSTLRAWERRYQVCQPQRTDSGYRLYSDRDVAIIRWLKTQVDAGMAISQAVSWLDTLTEEVAALEMVTLPGVNGKQNAPMTIASSRRIELRTSTVLMVELLEALLQFDEPAAEQVLSEAFGIYSLEQVGETIIAPAMIEIGDRWHRGELSVTVEHYVTNFLLHRLAILLRTANHSPGGQLIWVACPPSEQHEMGALLLVLYLRRAGHQVRYIGKDMPMNDFLREVQRESPTLVLFSASMIDSAFELATLTANLANLEPYAPIIGYGGRVFKQNPELRRSITGVYMGDTAYEAVESTAELLRNENMRM
jgi:MerR family transcriptional regulator, light-induced transcriptional regulator